MEGSQEASERSDGNKSEVAPPKNEVAAVVESETAPIVRAVSETSCACRTSKQRTAAFNLSKYARHPGTKAPLFPPSKELSEAPRTTFSSTTSTFQELK